MDLALKDNNGLSFSVLLREMSANVTCENLRLQQQQQQKKRPEREKKRIVHDLFAPELFFPILFGTIARRDQIK